MSNDAKIDYESRLTALEAYAVAAERGLDAGLEKIVASKDPEIVRRRLGLLLANDRVSDAADLIRDEEPHPRWCDTAITVLVRNGDVDAADRYLEWALKLDNMTTRLRCRVVYANALFVRAFRERQPGEPVLSGSLTPEEQQSLDRVIDVLSPIMTLVNVQRVVATELESLALQIAVRAFVHLGDLTNAKKHAALLESRRPVPIELAELVASRLVPCPNDLPARLRTEHPLSPQAKMLAAVIEGEILGRHQDAFRHYMEIEANNLTYDEKQQLCLLAHQTAKSVGNTEEQEAQAFAKRVLSQDDPFFDRLEVERLALAGNMKEAEEKLEQIHDEDSSLWLQIAANLARLKGDDQAAADYYAKAAEKHPHPALLETVASMAYEQSRYDVALQALEKSIALSPDDPVLRRNAAMTYCRVNDFAKAASHFEVLRQLEPHDIENSLNLAVCCAFSGDLEKSLEVYDDATSSLQAPLKALIGKSQVLVALNRGIEAFDLLHSVRTTHWDDPHFLAVYMNIGHLSGQDENAGKAMQRLIALRGTDDEAAAMIQPKSLDDIKDFITERRKEREFLHRQMLVGKAPWVFVDGLLGDVPFWGWFCRTHRLSWIGDDPVVRAENCIYATNGFSLVTADNEKGVLKRITCPPEGTAVVADISALITLHRLGLLTECASYFGEVFVPSAYQKAAFLHRERLGHHQLSQVESRITIRKAMDKGDVNVVPKEHDDQQPVARSMPLVDEYGDDEKDALYRIVDVMEVLTEQGLITEEIQKRVNQSVDRKSRGTVAPLQVSQSIQVDMSTLEAMNGYGLFEPLTRAFDVWITAEDEARLRSELLTLQSREDVRQWHEELWEKVRATTGFVDVSLAGSSGIESEEEQESVNPGDLGLTAAIYASRRKIPLLADDRVCQALTLNECRSDPSASIGCDILLGSLFNSERINRSTLADCYLALMRWRYRFLIPPVDVLIGIAEPFRDHPPGEKLQFVSRYVHDCMRDPGLFGGLEDTEPKMPMAYRFFTEWLNVVVDFLVHIWLVAQWPEERAALITQWTMEELMPSLPKAMGLSSARIASSLPMLAVSRAVFQAAEHDSYERANKCLRGIAEGFRLDDEEFLQVIAEVIDAI